MTDKQNSHSIYRVRQRHAVKELPLKVSTEIIDNNQEETHHIQMSSTPVKQHNHTGKKSHIIATQNISKHRQWQQNQSTRIFWQHTWKVLQGWHIWFSWDSVCPISVIRITLNDACRRVNHQHAAVKTSTTPSLAAIPPCKAPPPFRKSGGFSDSDVHLFVCSSVRLSVAWNTAAV